MFFNLTWYFSINLDTLIIKKNNNTIFRLKVLLPNAWIPFKQPCQMDFIFYQDILRRQKFTDFGKAHLSLESSSIIYNGCTEMWLWFCLTEHWINQPLLLCNDKSTIKKNCPWHFPNDFLLKSSLSSLTKHFLHLKSNFQGRIFLTNGS